jgi:Polyketide cyclase / dehydrase and lipid transport
MRILPVVAGCVVLLVLTVVVTGALLPKAHIASRAAAFNATPERLFALIAGPQNWRPDVVHYEVLPESAGHEMVRETTRNGETVAYEILDRNPPESIQRRIVTKNLPYSGTWTYTLQPDGARTVVRITENGEVYNPIFRFVSRFVIGHSRTIDDYLRALGKATGQKVQITN